MIRGIITDIDGVIVGDKIGYNTPNPHPDIIKRIKDIHASGVPVVLCTGKPHYAIKNIIEACRLDNPHVTDGGAIVIDPITNTIIQKHRIDPLLVTSLINSCLQSDMYIEIYTPDRYIIQRSQIRENLTPVHTHVLETPPTIVDDLVTESMKHEIIKLMPVAINTEDTIRLKTIYEPYQNDLTLAMGVHPIANPHQFGLITKKGVSKKQSAIDATAKLDIPLNNYLGIGDSTSDWSFMQLCGYTATLANGSDELKKLVNFVGPNVDENGILSVFDHFSLH